MTDEQPRTLEASVHQIPNSHFRNRGLTGEQRVAVEEAMPIFEREGRAPEGHILTYEKGALYPKKGTIAPDILNRLNIVKHLVNADVQTLGNKYAILPMLGFVLTPWTWKVKMLEHKLYGYLRICHSIIGGDFLNADEYQPVSKELWLILEKALLYIGITPDLAHQISECGIMPIEFDDAYRFPLLDIMSEIIPEQLMKNPRREIKRIGQIYMERESREGMRNKIGHYVKLLNWFLILPKAKKIIRAAFKDCNYERLKADMSDAYFCLRRMEGYNFGGYNNDQRWAYFVEIHTDKKGNINLPPMVTFSWEDSPQ